MELVFHVVAMTKPHNGEEQIVVCPKCPLGKTFPLLNRLSEWRRPSFGNHPFPESFTSSLTIGSD